MSPRPISTGVVVLLALAGAAGCASTPEPVDILEIPGNYLSGANYSHAVYDNDDRLIHSPIERLQVEMKRRKEDCRPPISDVYVLCHGWNFTIEESGILYENYRLSIQRWLNQLRGHADEGFEPFVIFVTWGSVSRPLTEAVESLLPLPAPDSLSMVTGVADTLVFHIPSSWGETSNAFRIALGTPQRLHTLAQGFYPGGGEVSEYQRARFASREAVRDSRYLGMETPLSTVLDELIRMKFADEDPAFALHAVGHSFGGKMASLAVTDACARIELADRVRGERHYGPGPLVDSMLLIQPAMKLTEMYFPPRVEDEWPPRLEDRDEPVQTASFVERINPFDGRPSVELGDALRHVGRKGIVANREDSANGWLFMLGQLVLRYEVISEINVTQRDDDLPVLQELGFVVDLGATIATSIIANVFGLIVEPIDAVNQSIHSFGEGQVRRGVRKLVTAPLAGLLHQRAIGHHGIQYVSSAKRAFALRNDWLNQSAQDTLNQHEEVDDDQFWRMSEEHYVEQCGDVRVEDTETIFVFDGSSVYSGYIDPDDGWFQRSLGQVGNVLNPGKAHGDLRSYEEAGGRSKRERTFHFVHHFTHLHSNSDQHHEPTAGQHHQPRAGQDHQPEAGQDPRP